jgi:hypothetical protein
MAWKSVCHNTSAFMLICVDPAPVVLIPNRTSVMQASGETLSYALPEPAPLWHFLSQVLTLSGWRALRELSVLQYSMLSFS